MKQACPKTPNSRQPRYPFPRRHRDPNRRWPLGVWHMPQSAEPLFRAIRRELWTGPGGTYQVKRLFSGRSVRPGAGVLTPRSGSNGCVRPISVVSPRPQTRSKRPCASRTEVSGSPGCREARPRPGSAHAPPACLGRSLPRSVPASASRFPDCVEWRVVWGCWAVVGPRSRRVQGSWRPSGDSHGGDLQHSWPTRLPTPDAPGATLALVEAHRPTTRPTCPRPFDPMEHP